MRYSVPIGCCGKRLAALGMTWAALRSTMRFATTAPGIYPGAVAQSMSFPHEPGALMKPYPGQTRHNANFGKIVCIPAR
jgi:hypothetical protein